MIWNLTSSGKEPVTQRSEGIVVRSEEQQEQRVRGWMELGLWNRTKASVAGTSRMRGRGVRDELNGVQKAGRNGEDQSIEGLSARGGMLDFIFKYEHLLCAPGLVLGTQM